jgi:DnaK suppressor protein
MAATAPNPLHAPDAAGTPATEQTLRAERERLLRALRAHAEAERALGEDQGGASGWGQEACVASDLVAEATLAALDDEERRRLADVEAALRRLARGRFGVCEACGGPVPAARLRALPWTRRCVACARRREAARRRAPAGRPDRSGGPAGARRTGVNR